MVNNVLKYRTGNLIILYHYIYSKLSGTIENVIWNSIGLMKSAGSGPWVESD